jgi:hypothetical protein
VALLIGRILVAASFIVSGSTTHLLKWREGISYARASSVPAPELLVPASGVMAVGGGLLVAFYGPISGRSCWPPSSSRSPSECTRSGRFDDPIQRANQQVHFMKNVSLGGAALALFALFQQFGSEL